MNDDMRVIAGHLVVRDSPASRAAIRVLEKADYVRQAERFSDDAHMVYRQAVEALEQAKKELSESEGYRGLQNGL